MTSPNDPNPDLENSPGVSDTARAIAAQIGAPDTGGAKEQETAVQSQGGPLTGEVTVDWGGTERSVKVEDLVAAARRAEEVTTQQGLVDGRLAEMGELQRLRGVLDGLDPVQLQQLQTLVADPTQLTAMANGHPRQQQAQESDLEKQVERLVSGNPANPPPANTAEFEELRRTVGQLVSHANSSLAKDQVTSREDHVAAQMKSYPVFSEIEGSTGLHSRTIMNAIATAGPNASVENIVAQHAADLHGLIQASRKGATEPRPGGAPTPLATPAIPEGWKPKAGDLFNRNILRAAEQKFREITGGG